MNKLIDLVKKNKKLIIVSAVIIILILIVYIINVQSQTSQSVGGFAQKTQTELKLASILSSIDGVGDADVMINESEGVITGVVIVCDGADNIMVRNDIINAVSTALSVKRSAIAIYSMTI